MRFDRVPGLVAAVLAAGILLASATAPDGKAAAPAAVRLVRVDLLSKASAEIVPPRRDIFRAQPAFAPPGPGSLPQVTEPVPPPAEEDKAPDEAVPEPGLDLTYVGYISSAHRIVALVVVGGQAQAVAEGEEVVPGVKIEKVSRDKISLLGPGSKRTVVPLQGEES
jgi:hypothetical protein